MSIDADSSQHEQELETDNEQIISLLKAILLGISQIGTLTPEELISMTKGL